jgi:hypothetical protein
MQKLKDAYFAGLIDGEGCIRMDRLVSEHRETPCVEVKMTCRKTIEALRDHFGFGTIFERKPEKPHYKPQWRWRVRNKSAALVLQRVLPYLITKRREAEAVFARRFIKKTGG